MKFEVYKGKELVGEAVLMKSDQVYMTQFFKNIHATEHLKEADFKSRKLRLEPVEVINVEDDIPDDVCCCGDAMKNHESALTCGHSPVSMRAYYESCREKAK